MTPQKYWLTARELRYSITFAFPLLVLYELLALAISHSAFAGVRNGADVLLKTLFVSLGGRAGLAVFGTLLLGIGTWVVWRDHRRRGGAFNTRIFVGMFAESLVYAALLGGVVSTLTAWLLPGPLFTLQGGQHVIPLGTQLVISLGAGIYEELLFRLLLVSALYGVGTYLGWSKPVAVTVAIVGSALIFSGFHYVGPLGDRLTLPSFTFRAIAGLLLSGLFVARGLGITAWTHALYDIGVTIINS